MELKNQAGQLSSLKNLVQYLLADRFFGGGIEDVDGIHIEGDELEVRTWIADMKRVRAQRKYDFTRKSDGKVVAKGETLWIYVELTTGRPIPIPNEIAVLFPITAE